MNRANPADLRKALDMVTALHKAGILFVPMPVADCGEFESRAKEAWTRLDELALDAEDVE